MLRSEGHDAVHVFEVGLNRAGDHQILKEAARARRILLTSDLDFGDILAQSSGRVSVVILRLRSNTSAVVTGRLKVALAQAASALEHGAVVVVGEASLRLRRRPLGA